MYRHFVFSFEIHLAIKDKDVLETIRELLGGIGRVLVNEADGSCTF